MKTIEDLEQELENEKVMSISFSNDAEFLRRQNEILSRRLKLTQNAAKSLCADVRRFQYGRIAVMNYERNIKSI